MYVHLILNLYSCLTIFFDDNDMIDDNNSNAISIILYLRVQQNKLRDV